MDDLLIISNYLGQDVLERPDRTGDYGTKAKLVRSKVPGLDAQKLQLLFVHTHSYSRSSQAATSTNRATKSVYRYAVEEPPSKLDASYLLARLWC